MQNTLKIFLVLMVMVSIVGAVPPQTSKAEFGLELRTGAAEVVQQNTSFDFHVHVFNASNGAFITEDTSCYLHLYNSSGHHLYEGIDSVVSHDFDYAWDIHAGNFSQEGILEYIVQCNDTVGQGGFVAGSIEVNKAGATMGVPDAIVNSAMILLFLGGAIFFLIFSKSTEHPGIKLFLSIVGYLVMMLSIGMAYILIEGVQTNANVIPKAMFFIFGITLIVMMYYIFINITRNALTLMKVKKGFGSEYDNPPTF